MERGRRKERGKCKKNCRDNPSCYCRYCYHLWHVVSNRTEMRTKSTSRTCHLTCKKCGLMVKSDDPNSKDGVNHNPGEHSGNGDNPDLNSDAHSDEEDGEEQEGTFIWPTSIDESVPRPMPPISEEHRNRIDRLKNDGIITNQRVYEIMMSLDFAIFYDIITDEWIEHNYVLLDRSSDVVKEGDRVLVFPFNTYYSVALSLMLGPKGSVICYGHLQNTFTMKKCGLEWLMTDHRLKFRNKEEALYYAVPLQVFQEVGWPRMAPFNVIMMSDQPLNGAIEDQLSEEGVVFKPDTGDFLFRNHAGM